MGRRKRSGFADDVIALVTLMPWWAGVLLAIAFYVALHHYAAAPLSMPATKPGEPLSITPMVTKGLALGLAQLGQYLMPALCLAGAAVSFWKRRQSAQLMQRASGSDAAAAIDGMTWQEFERLIAEAFRRRGYSAAELGGNGPDGGVDVVLRRGTEKFFVQCKHWRAQRVGVDVVRELYGVMAAKGATGGFVVTSGRFSQDAMAFAEGRNIQLVDGPELKRLLHGVGAPRAPVESPQPVVEEAPAPATPRCPRCDGPMVQRLARKGSAAGQSFWGCATYPQCRGTRPA